MYRLIKGVSYRFSSHYEVLGIPTNATPDQIRKAFLKQARKYHPDVNKSDQAKEIIKKINLAYEHLKDVDKRKIYDLGLNNPNFAEDSNPENSATYDHYYNPTTGNQKAYYANKWYGYKKPGDDNLREQYMRAHEQFKKTRAAEQMKGKIGIFIKMTAIVGLLFGGEIIVRYFNNKYQKRLETSRKIIENGTKENPNKIGTVGVQKYIDIRAQLNKSS